MTKLLRTAFEAASELPEEEQDAMARWLLAELESERRWAEQFGESSETLSRLATEALAEDSAGETQDLDLTAR